MRATRKSTIIAFILLITFFSSVNVIAKTAAEVFQKVSPSIVVVHVYDEKGKVIGLGSGVVLPGGDIATNYHVVEKATKIKVHRGGKDYDAVLRYSDRGRDVCSLSAPSMKVPPVSMGSTKTLKVGSRVYAIGSPRGLELTLSEGIISSLRPVEGGQYLQITAPISPGSSGGGLFDEEGRLIGLTTFYLAEGQQLNFAVPVEWVGELPKRHKNDVQPAKTAVDWLNQGLALEEKKDWAGLLNHAVQWVKVYPRDTIAWFILGIAYGKSSQYTKAIEAYEQAIRINSEFADAWYNLGLAHGKSSQYTKAIEAYQQAIRINSEHPKAWYSLGLVYSISGQYTEAIEAYQQAIRINSEDVDAWTNLGLVYVMSSQSSKAIEACVQAVHIKQEDADAWFCLGLAYKESGQKGQVMEVYKRLKTIDRAKADEFFKKVVLP